MEPSPPSPAPQTVAGLMRKQPSYAERYLIVSAPNPGFAKRLLG